MFHAYVIAHISIKFYAGSCFKILCCQATIEIPIIYQWIYCENLITAMAISNIVPYN